MQSVEVDFNAVIAGLKKRLADALETLVMTEVAVEQYQGKVNELEEKIAELEERISELELQE